MVLGAPVLGALAASLPWGAVARVVTISVGSLALVDLVLVRTTVGTCPLFPQASLADPADGRGQKGFTRSERQDRQAE